MATLLIAAFFAGVVYYFWHHRDFAACTAVYGVLIVGVRCVSRMLPVPQVLRAWWTQMQAPQEQELLKDSWAVIFRQTYWVGPWTFLNNLWREGGFRLPNREELFFIAASGIVSVIAHLRCRQIVRQAEKSQ
ncbi:MAG: hypothetical protein P4L99_16725 [Chthoniobacter sp.]|nr:hypothetical protein [Chthoniobacter sp.]